MENYFLIMAPGRPDLYWRANSRGYTTKIAQAGVYSEKEANGIVGNKRGDKSIPLINLKEELFRDLKEATLDIEGLVDKINLIRNNK